MRWAVLGVALWLLVLLNGLVIWYVHVRIRELQRIVFKARMQLEHHIFPEARSGRIGKVYPPKDTETS
jgi:hypothetical protein